MIGDIEQVFHPILVVNDHHDALRFLWTNNFSTPVEDYHMNVHLFGKVNSPYMKNWMVKRTAKDQSEVFDTNQLDIN